MRKLPFWGALQSQVLLVVGSSTQDSKDHAGSSRGASISMCRLSWAGESLIRQASFPRGRSLRSSPTISDPSKSCGRPSKVRSNQESGPRSLEGSRVVRSSKRRKMSIFVRIRHFETLRRGPSDPFPMAEQKSEAGFCVRPLIMVDDNLHSIPFYYRSRLFSATR